MNWIRTELMNGNGIESSLMLTPFEAILTLAEKKELTSVLKFVNKACGLANICLCISKTGKTSLLSYCRFEAETMIFLNADDDKNERPLDHHRTFIVC